MHCLKPCEYGRQISILPCVVGRVNSQSHADTEDGDLASKVLDSISTDARIRLRMARSWADYQLGRLLGDQLLQGDLIIAEDMDSGTLKNKVLVNVPGEGVVVVDEDEVGSSWDRRRRVRLLGGVVNDA
jgi:hypothetical protein